MTTRYSRQTKGVLDGTQPARLGDSKYLDGRVHRLFAEFVLGDAQIAAGDVLVLGKLEKGSVFNNIWITSSVSLGASTISLGNTATPSKYRSAATFTAVDAPTPFGKEAGKIESVAEETLIATIGAADLPSAGRLIFEVLYTRNESG